MLKNVCHKLGRQPRLSFSHTDCLFLFSLPLPPRSQRLVRAFKAVEELRYLDDEALLSKLIYTAEKYQQLAFGQSVYDPNMFRDIEVFFGL